MKTLITGLFLLAVLFGVATWSAYRLHFNHVASLTTQGAIHT